MASNVWKTKAKPKFNDPTINAQIVGSPGNWKRQIPAAPAAVANPTGIPNLPPHIGKIVNPLVENFDAQATASQGWANNTVMPWAQQNLNAASTISNEAQAGYASRMDALAQQNNANLAGMAPPPGISAMGAPSQSPLAYQGRAAVQASQAGQIANAQSANYRAAVGSLQGTSTAQSLMGNLAIEAARLPDKYEQMKQEYIQQITPVLLQLQDSERARKLNHRQFGMEMRQRQKEFNTQMDADLQAQVYDRIFQDEQNQYDRGQDQIENARRDRETDISEGHLNLRAAEIEASAAAAREEEQLDVLDADQRKFANEEALEFLKAAISGGQVGGNLASYLGDEAIIDRNTGQPISRMMPKDAAKYVATRYEIPHAKALKIANTLWNNNHKKWWGAGSDGGVPGAGGV